MATALAASLQAIRLRHDDWMHRLALNLRNEPARARVEKLQWPLAKQLFAAGLTVILEWRTWARAERGRLRLEARALGAAVELRTLLAPADVLFERIARRAAEDPPIQLAELQQWLALCEAPTPDELALFDEPSLTSA